MLLKVLVGTQGWKVCPKSLLPLYGAIFLAIVALDLFLAYILYSYDLKSPFGKRQLDS